MTIIPKTIITLAALLVGACSPAVYSVTQDRAFSMARAHFLGGGKELQTIIRGNPFDEPQDRLNGMVIGEMGRSLRRSDTALTRRPLFMLDEDGGLPPGYWVALTLNAVEEGQSETLCGDPGALAVSPPIAPAGRIEARMVFCYNGQLLSTSRGVLEDVEGLTDPRFRGLIAAMTRELFPTRDDRDHLSRGLI